MEQPPPDDDDDIPFYHESPTLLDISPDDERFLMNLSDVVGELKPRGLMFASDDEEEVPPLVPRGGFTVYEDVTTPEKDQSIVTLKGEESRTLR